MTEKEQILTAMKEAGTPLNAGKIAEMTGLDRKVVDREVYPTYTRRTGTHHA